MYIQSTSLGQIFCKSIAFLQVELSLQAKDKNILDLVEVSCDFCKYHDSISQNMVEMQTMVSLKAISHIE